LPRRFKSTSNAVLLATDVAARGLDIPAVDHVIHFQIPRTADTYIHRSGRTARANREGFSMLMCAPDERKVVRALMYSLGRDEGEIPELELELGLLDKLKERVRLAKEIEKMQHKTKKGKFEKSWMKEAADALEVDLDSDFFRFVCLSPHSWEWLADWPHICVVTMMKTGVTRSNRKCKTPRSRA
jgi:ATP-dependent RNA helicase DDX24/MAK5